MGIIILILLIIIVFFLIRLLIKRKSIIIKQYEQVTQEKITASEYILSLGLIIFLLIGGIRILYLLGEIPKKPDWGDFEIKYNLLETQGKTNLIESEVNQIQNIFDKTNREFEDINKKYIFQREHYRIMVEIGEKTDKEKEDYLNVKELWNKSQRKLEIARNRLEETKKKLENQLDKLNNKRKFVEREFEKAKIIYESKSLFWRLLYALPLLLISIVLFQKVKGSGRYTIISGSFMIFSLLQSIFLVFQYSLHIFEGMVEIIVSVFGATSCIIGLVYIKKHIFNIERISKVKFIRKQCPKCNFPFNKENFYCQNCGMKLAEKCPECNNIRYIITKYCSYCGIEIK